MSELIKKANELDKANNIDDQSVEQAARRLSYYNRRLSKLKVVMRRTETNQPTPADFDALTRAESHYLKE